jgi:hypothetical protein
LLPLAFPVPLALAFALALPVPFILAGAVCLTLALALMLSLLPVLVPVRVFAPAAILGRGARGGRAEEGHDEGAQHGAPFPPTAE